VAVRACCTGINTGFTAPAEVDIVATEDAFTWSARNAFAAAVAKIRNLPSANVVVNDWYAVLGTPVLRAQLTITDYNADSQYVIVPKLASAVEDHNYVVGGLFVSAVRTCCAAQKAGNANVEVDINASLDAFVPSVQTDFAAAVAVLHNIPSNNVGVVTVAPVLGSGYVRVRLNIIDFWVDNSNAILTKFQSVVEHNGYKIGGYAVKAVFDCCSNLDTAICAAVMP